jgi:indole-3-glycerol phosphate synthase
LPEAQPTNATWIPPAGPLGELTARAAASVEAARGSISALEHAAARAAPPASFAAALRGPDVRLIAELKRRSPSKGDINLTMNLGQRAAEYAAGGAAALSVLTEPTRFGGSLQDLEGVHRLALLPLLRKDFIVDRLQLLEARAAGASAVLLIARALPPARLAALASEAAALGLDLLVEVRSEEELERALRVPRAVIGVNNRNLETLVIDDTVSARLLPLIPEDRIAVYESGITDRRGVERSAQLGADAVLVGSSLSASAGGAAAVAALTGVTRNARG